MRYGMCTDFATKTRDRVEYELLRRIKDAGFDFVEFPLMMIETLSDEDFETLLKELKRLELACDVSCNFFPGRIKVVGSLAKKDEIDAYLDKAMGRAVRMGVKTIVFGSCPSRNLPEGESEEQGYDELCGMLSESVIPFCRKYGVQVVMEPIRRPSANFVITLEDGLKVVERMNAPEIELLADLMHMHYNDENPQELRKAAPRLRHVHVCEMDRLLPEDGYSEHLNRCLDVLVDCGYDRTITFEAKDETRPTGLRDALTLLKQKFEA